MIYPVPNLSVLAVSGTDAAQFLQGQSTCNIKQVTDAAGSFGAFCTPQGRTVCTFFIVKQQETFLLVIASDLQPKVIKRLQLYILRSDVQLHDTQQDYKLFGFLCPDSVPAGIDLPDRQFAVSHGQQGLCINLSEARRRFLCIVLAASATDFQAGLIENAAASIGNAADWQYWDMLAGIPWLNCATSEQFTPQMINLDLLHGISFNKGCYTGQEIVARTHYLGKAKRHMYLALSNAALLPQPGTAVVDISESQPQPIGTVITACQRAGKIVMLVVLPIAHAASEDLALENRNHERLSVTELSY